MIYTDALCKFWQIYCLFIGTVLSNIESLSILKLHPIFFSFSCYFSSFSFATHISSFYFPFSSSLPSFSSSSFFFFFFSCSSFFSLLFYRPMYVFLLYFFTHPYSHIPLLNLIFPLCSPSGPLVNRHDQHGLAFGVSVCGCNRLLVLRS